MGKFEDFILNELEKRFPNYLKIGDEYLIRKQYIKAIESYQKAMEAQSQNPYLYYNWAACHFALGQHEEATKKLKISVRLKPDFSDAFVSWGLALMSQHRLREAVNKFKKASKISPDDPKVWFNYGSVLEMLEYPEDALKMYLKTLELAPVTGDGTELTAPREHVQALNKIALMELGKNNYKEAIKMYQQAVKLDPKFSPAYYNLAVSLAKIGKNDAAIKSLARAMDNDASIFNRAKEEPAFEPLKAEPEFKKLIP
jgi:tetratricopeptide (TPR) repeat protein